MRFPFSYLCYRGSLIKVHRRYHRLGYEWASTLLAFISLACCAIPYIFYFYGARIRKHSKYAYSGDDTLPTTNKA